MARTVLRMPSLRLHGATRAPSPSAAALSGLRGGAETVENPVTHARYARRLHRTRAPAKPRPCRPFRINV